MTEKRTTWKDCEASLERLKQAAIKVGFDPRNVERWGISYGSRYYGNTSRLYQVGTDASKVTDAEQAANRAMHTLGDHPYGSGHYHTGFPEFLGWGPTETNRTLRTITSTLWAVTYERSEVTR